MTGPLSRVMPCPACLHDHLYLKCDWCGCTEKFTPGAYSEEPHVSGLQLR